MGIKRNKNENEIKPTNKKKSKTSLGTKIFVWFMFLAMLLSFALPILSYLLNLKN